VDTYYTYMTICTMVRLPGVRLASVIVDKA